MNLTLLKEWLSHELKIATLSDIHQAEPPRNISLKLAAYTHLKLQRVAGKLNDSKSSCGQKILALAVDDIYDEMGFPEVTVEDVQQYARENFGGAESSTPLKEAA